MALDGAYEHRKTRRLARALQVQPWAAIGLLEVFWRWCRRSAKHGRIDADQWEDVADFLQWQTSADDLRNLLIGHRFVDEMGGWDWVHDWHHHADNTTRTYLDRRAEKFANGSPARIPKDGYREDVETKPKDVETKPEIVEPTRARGQSQSQSQSQSPLDTEKVEVLSRRRREKKEKSDSEVSGTSKAAPKLFSIGDDDERIRAGAEAYVVELIEKATKEKPDSVLMKRIQECIMKAGTTWAAYATEIRERIPRLKDPPRPAFFLHHAQNIGKTAESEMVKQSLRVELDQAKLDAMQTPKAPVIEPTPGCGCIDGVAFVDGKHDFCKCEKGRGYTARKRANK